MPDGFSNRLHMKHEYDVTLWFASHSCSNYVWLDPSCGKRNKCGPRL